MAMVGSLRLWRKRQLDVRYNAKVTKITRTGAAGTRRRWHPFPPKVEYTWDGLSSVENEDRDILVLSGPITEFVRGRAIVAREMRSSPLLQRRKWTCLRQRGPCSFLSPLWILRRVLSSRNSKPSSFGPILNFQLNPESLHRDVAYVEGRAHTPHTLRCSLIRFRMRRIHFPTRQALGSAEIVAE